MKRILLFGLLFFIGVGIVYDMARPEINDWLSKKETIETVEEENTLELIEENSNIDPIEDHKREAVVVEQLPEEKLSEKIIPLENTTTPRLLFPVADKDDSSIISFFGDPRSGGKRLHQGIDIAAPRGTPVVAVETGKITSVGEKGNAGKFVWLHVKEKNIKYFYAHLNEQWVKEGELVTAGTELGTVGNTGNARHTLPHLHFEIRKKRIPIDPLPYVQRRMLP